MTTAETKTLANTNEQTKENSDVSQNSDKLETLQSELITEKLDDVNLKVVDKSDIDKSMLVNKSDYLRDEPELKLALSNIMLKVVRNIGSTEHLKMILDNMGVKNFTDDDVKNTYDFLSKGDIDGKTLNKEEARTFQLLLAKASQTLENVMKQNSRADRGADGMIGGKTLDAINIFSTRLLEKIPSDIAKLDIRDLEPLKQAAISMDLIKNYKNIETKKIGGVRLEAHTEIDFGKRLNLNEMANILSMYYEQISRDNLDPSVSFVVGSRKSTGLEPIGDGKEITLISRDKKREIKFDENRSKLGIYGDTGSLHLKNPNAFKGSVLDGTLNVTKYENNSEGEKRQVSVKSRSDIENMQTWKGDAFSKMNINEISLAGGALKISGELNVEDAKTVSNAMEKEFEGLDNRYNQFGELKTKSDFTKWYSDGKHFLDKLADANIKYGDKIDYKNLNIVMDPYKVSKMFEATGIFKGGLSVVQDLFGAMGPVEMKGKELKEIVDLIGVSIDVPKYGSVETDKASRKLVDIAVNKFTGSNNLDALIEKTLSQAQFQLDGQKTLAVKEGMYNMMKNGEQFVLLGELSQNKTGMALLRLNNVENAKTGVFAFVEHSNSDVYVTPFRNYYNKANVGMENVSTTSVGAGLTHEMYNKNGLKISGEAVAKYMNISGINTGNVILNVPSGELPIGEIAKTLGYKPEDIGSIDTGNAYVGIRLEKEGLNYGVDASLGLTGAIKKSLNNSFDFVNGIGIKPLFDANGYYKPTDKSIVNANITTDGKYNTYGKVSGEYQFNDKLSAGAFVGNDGVKPVGMNNELTKFSGMNPGNNIEAGAFGSYRPNQDSQVNAYVTNQRAGVNAQKTFYTNKGNQITGFVGAGVDGLGAGKVSPTIEAGVKFTTDQVTKIVKNTGKKAKGLFK